MELMEGMADAGDNLDAANMAMGGKTKKQGTGDEDPVTAFLTQVPPDWEKAELHGMANLVLDSSKTKLNPDDPSSFCPCCQMPYPNDEDFYDLTVSNMDLGALGPGFPLFFVLMQMLVAYLFGLTLIYFVPMYFRITESLEELEKHDYFIESRWAMFSYGAFVMGSQHGNDTHYQANMTKEEFFTSQVENIQALGLFFIISCLYSFIAFFFMRKKLFAMAEELNAKSLTPADYCVMAMGTDFDDNGS